MMNNTSKSFCLPKWRSEAGFTAIELLIAIQLSLIIISLGYVTYLFSTKLVNRWQEKVMTENSIAQISSTLPRAVDRIQEVVIASDKKLLGLDQNQDTVIISLDGGIFYNSNDLTAGLRFEQGQFRYFQRLDTSYDLLETKNPASVHLIRIDLNLAQGSATQKITLLSRLTRRRPSMMN